MGQLFSIYKTETLTRNRLSKNPSTFWNDIPKKKRKQSSVNGYTYVVITAVSDALSLLNYTFSFLLRGMALDKRLTCFFCLNSIRTFTCLGTPTLAWMMSALERFHWYINIWTISKIWKKTLKRSTIIYLLKNQKAFERLSFLLAPQAISENTWSLKIRDDIAQSTIQNFTWNSLFNFFMKEIPIKSMNWFLW